MQIHFFKDASSIMHCRRETKMQKFDISLFSKKEFKVLMKLEKNVCIQHFSTWAGRSYSQCFLVTYAHINGDKAVVLIWHKLIFNDLLVIFWSEHYCLTRPQAWTLCSVSPGDIKTPWRTGNVAPTPMQPQCVSFKFGFHINRDTMQVQSRQGWK